MRVVGGTAKGARLSTPRGAGARPTLDRVREAIFDILGDRVTGARVLDLFAGSGALGIEALSRGAAVALFVEKDRRIAQVIGKNLSACRLAGKGSVKVADAIRSLRRLGREGKKFDLVFLDPPYNRGLVMVTVAALAEAELVDREGLVVAEHSPKEEVGEWWGPFRLMDRRAYGATRVSLLEMGTGSVLT